MRWIELKARLLAAGDVRVRGVPVDGFISRSHAGPSAGGGGSIFFAVGDGRVRLSINPESSLEIVHLGDGVAELHIDDTVVMGRIEGIGLHCPKQAYITVSEGCIFRCRYCPVPFQEVRVKTPDEVVQLVETVLDRIDAISITSGVVGSIEDDEERVCAVVSRLVRFGIPIGVSIYPTSQTPKRLHELGVAEVKFNLETASRDLFDRLCPGLSRETIWEALKASVPLFGRNHVFSNVILGLGETDGELRTCIRELCDIGVIPVIRPLNPAGDLVERPRPSPARLIATCRVHEKELFRAGLDPKKALTMCVACTGCDLVPWRDT